MSMHPTAKGKELEEWSRGGRKRGKIKTLIWSLVYGLADCQ